MTTQTQQQSLKNPMFKPPKKPPVGFLDLEKCGGVLVKFTFKDELTIPQSIPVVVRASDAEMDALHECIALQDERPELAKVGRHREGRVDTGEPVLSTTRPTQVAFLRKGLANNGWRLVMLHRFVRMVPKKYKKGDPAKTNGSGEEKVPVNVVVAGFAPENVAEAKGYRMTEVQLKSLRELAALTLSNVHLWDNPTTIGTINCVGALPEQRPKVALLVREGKVVEQEIPDKVEERDE